VNPGGRAIRCSVLRRIIWFVAGAAFLTVVPQAAVAAASEHPSSNRPVVADPPSPAVPQITPSYDNKPLRKADGPASQDNKPGADASDSGLYSLEFPRLVGATALVISLIFLLRWVARRFFGVAPVVGGTRAVQVVSRSLIAPRQSVMLLRVGRRLLVVADNGSQLSSLSEIADPDEVAALVGQVQSEKIDIAGRTFGAFIGRFKKDELVASTLVEAPVEVADEHVMETPTADGSRDGSDVSSARAELSGLMEQVRLVSSQFNRS
jgi:flagellar biogenesis protein FliO